MKERLPGFGAGSDASAIAEAIPQMIWTALPDGTVDYLNGRIYEYGGTARGDLTGWSWERAVHRDDLSAVLATWTRALADGEPAEIECRLRRHDGAYRWFLIRANAVRDASGALTRWFGSCTDIDALRTASARDAFLANADALFGAQLDAAAILGAVASAAVVSFADYCLFDLAADDGSLRRAAVDHRDPARRGPFQRSVGTVPPVEHPHHPISLAWRHGESLLLPRIDEGWWRQVAQDEGHFARMRDEGLSSLIAVVVAARGRRYGVLTFCRSRGSHPYGESDLATAQELARRIGAALENARLYSEARAAAEAQRRIAERETFYARLGEALAETLDLHETLAAAAQLLVPEFADWAVVNLVDADGELVLAASQHRDPATTERTRALLGFRYLAAGAGGGSPEVVRTKRPLLYERVPEAGMGALRGTYRETIRALGVTSTVIVPLVYRGAVRGTLVTMYDRSSGRHYGSGDVPFCSEIARRISPAVGNAEAYERERRVARTFQAAALTTDLPRVPGTSFDALYEAGRSEALIGGDWYDAFRVADGRVVVSVGDVAGSGLDAAATMAAIRQSLRGAAAINPEPSVMLDAADRVLRSQTPDRFVTAWVGVFDPLWSTLACASAGHPAPLRRDAGGAVATLPAGGLPLGLRERGTDVTRHLELPENSTLLLYTDGLIEAGRDVLAGEAALVEALRAVDVADEPARAIHRAVLAGTGASDDVALLVVTFARSLLAQRDDVALRWTFDAHDGDRARTVRHEIDAWLERHGVGDADRVMAELVYAELVGNVARYAPGAVELALDLSGEYAVLHVIDAGAGFQHNARLPADALAESGRGLYIVSSVADEFSVTRRPDGGAHARAVLKGRLAQARAIVRR